MLMKKIIINSLRDYKEVEKFLGELGSEEYEVVIKTITLLPLEIIKKLFALKEHIVKFHVEDKQLTYYLKSLGFCALNLPNERAKRTSKVAVAAFSREELALFLDDISQKYHRDFRHYRQEYLLRRIGYFLSRNPFESLDDFKHKVLSQRKVFEKFFLDISINVTTFFRDPMVFKVLKKHLKEEFQTLREINIWCAGCSSGEEPYSVAIMLDELGILEKSHIYSTDINSAVLQKAKNGAYSKEKYQEFLENYRLYGGTKNRFDSYFEDYGDFVIVNNKLKKHILFMEHNLLTTTVLDKFNILFCRNVIIYFDSYLREKILTLLEKSLQNDAFLILGESESIQKEHIIAVDKRKKIYKKVRG